jgi:hypothetical protein
VGSFDLIFLDTDQEQRRFIVPLELVSISLGQATRDPTGGFEFQMEGLPTFPASIEAGFGGDDIDWPAYARTDITDE